MATSASFTFSLKALLHQEWNNDDLMSESFIIQSSDLSKTLMRSELNQLSSEIKINMFYIE